MKIFLILCISILFNSSLFANNFSQKKIIKLEQQENFEIIDLQQNVMQQNLDQQKGIFDSSSLASKKESIRKDQDIDFAIVMSFRQNFGYFLDGFRVSAKEFSTLFSKNLVDDLKLNFVNSAANGVYQDSRTLTRFSPKDSKLLNVSSFLKKEKDKSKIYAKFTDYLVVVNLDDFYVNITNYFVTITKNAVANINFKVVSTSNGKILTSKNVRLNFALHAEEPRINYQELVNQMPNMLAEVINKELGRLNLTAQ
ncbi:hypothetical protein B11476_15400 [Campylobacter coli]|nr:hypothetical protein [Campylobacter coli]EAW7550835.1 hypothetical protein [Campylobacter coli]EGK8202572.1 hypothetical protein [Campylobacter coli]BEK37837.1 hypothetical protein B11476_15400 [Campylobacter coli]HDV6425301.1 hypothetical protein [Campylobacter coli]